MRVSICEGWHHSKVPIDVSCVLAQDFPILLVQQTHGIIETTAQQAVLVVRGHYGSYRLYIVVKYYLDPTIERMKGRIGSEIQTDISSLKIPMKKWLNE